MPKTLTECILDIVDSLNQKELITMNMNHFKYINQIFHNTGKSCKSIDNLKISGIDNSELDQAIADLDKCNCGNRKYIYKLVKNSY